MISREGGESAATDARLGQYLRDAREVTDDVPFKLDIERQQAKASFNARVAGGVSHRAPVILVQQERHLERVAQKHEWSIPARAQLWTFQKPRPFLMTETDQKVGRGRDLYAG